MEFPPEPGGIGEYAYQTAVKLSEYGHSVLTIVHYEKITESDFAHFLKDQDFDIVRFDRYNGRTISLIQNFYFFIRQIRDHKTDLIFITSSTAGIIGRIMKCFYNIPYFIVGHGSEFLKSSFIHEVLIQFCYNGAAVILTNSKYTLSLIKQTRIKNTNLSVLYPGADERLFNSDHYYPKKTSKKNVILTVGALSLRKGHRQVLEALYRLKNSELSFEYWIIGKGDEEISLKTYVHDLGLDEFVIFLGFITREELPKYYRDADIFILGSSDLNPTQVEGFGIVLVEANLMKKPVIGSCGTGMEEIIIPGYNGLLVDMKNASEVATAIESLLIDKQKALLLGENGYKHIIENFTWSKFGHQLNGIILQYFKSKVRHKSSCL